MTRMRTIDRALDQLRHDDPGCCLTRHALRQMVLLGKVPYIMCGNKYLLNYDALLRVLGGEISDPKELMEPGTIRRICYDENGRRISRVV